MPEPGESESEPSPPRENSPGWKRKTKIVAGVLVPIIAGAIGVALSPIAQTIGEKPLKGQDFTVNVETNYDTFTSAGFATISQFFFEKDDPSNIAPPPNGKLTDIHLHGWGHDNGGQEFGANYFQFSVSARNVPVQLTGAWIEVVGEIPTKRGIVATCKCGGPLMVRHVRVDLDSRLVEYRSGDPGAPPEPLALTLEPGETELFSVKSDSKRCNCEWELKLNAVVDGEKQVITVDSGEGPFNSLGSEVNDSRNVIWTDAGWSPE